MVSTEEIAAMRAYPDHVLWEMLGDLEEYVRYAFEKKWLDCIPEKEERVSVIKSELGARGAFE